MNLDHARQVLAQYRALQGEAAAEERETFLSVSGFPQYENVLSNLLTFLFDTASPHGMRDLWVRALLRCLAEEDAMPMEASAEREVTTEKGGRIDIVIETDTHIIGIEHKVWAGLYNDLEDYAAYLHSHADGRCVRLVILAPVRYEKPGCQSVTHEQLFAQVRALLGEYLDGADATWLLCMKDFMYTVGRLKGVRTMDKERFGFLAEHAALIHQMSLERKRTETELKPAYNELWNALEKCTPLAAAGRIDFYRTIDDIYLSCYVDLSFSPHLTVEAYLDPEGWRVAVFDRGDMTEGRLDALRAQLEALGEVVREPSYPTENRLNKLTLTEALPKEQPDAVLQEMLRLTDVCRQLQ